ncbi:MAG: hypothetical protein IJE53_06685 [Bacilli bacterium]|nr:hypothetical protein [Bacilli bacterium]
MKLKKLPKIIMIGVALLLVIALAIVLAINFWPQEQKVKEVKVLKSIDEYGYELKDNKTKKYKELFKELEDILREDEVNQEEYAKKVAQMFVYDFFSLEDKAAKTDVGGVDFVHPNAVANFLVNAEDTYYKYIESNIYGERKQDLPAVDVVTVDSIEETEFAYNNEMHPGYEVRLSWTYTDDKFSDYQKNAIVILIKSDIKYYVVQI